LFQITYEFENDLSSVQLRRTLIESIQVTGKIDTREILLRMRAYQHVFLRIQEGFSVKRNARNHRVYKMFRRYTFVGQRYCINEDILGNN
jgi:hypothetical protein